MRQLFRDSLRRERGFYWEIRLLPGRYPEGYITAITDEATQKEYELPRYCQVECKRPADLPEPGASYLPQTYLVHSTPEPITVFKTLPVGKPAVKEFEHDYLKVVEKIKVNLASRVALAQPAAPCRVGGVHREPPLAHRGARSVGQAHQTPRCGRRRHGLLGDDSRTRPHGGRRPEPRLVCAADGLGSGVWQLVSRPCRPAAVLRLFGVPVGGGCSAESGIRLAGVYRSTGALKSAVYTNRALSALCAHPGTCTWRLASCVYIPVHAHGA